MAEGSPKRGGVFVVCGEALMDVYVRDITPTGLLLDARVGGSPFNVAVGLSRLAQPVQFLGGISYDAPGERLMQALRAEGVGTGRVMRSAAPTTLGVVSLGRTGVPSYAFHGTGAADRMLDEATLSPLTEGVRALQLGSFSVVVEPVGGALRALAARERGRLLLSYDPNVRLSVESDLDRWRSVVCEMVGLAHLVKVSDEDLGLLYPDRAPAQVADDWLNRGVQLVVVTRGASGSEAWNGRGHASVPSLLVEVVDTVGAGDTFQAALLTWLAEHDALSVVALKELNEHQMAALLRFGAQAASITCSRRGADLPRRDELA